MDKNQAEQFQMCIDHAPSYVRFCKKKSMQEGVWLLYIFFHNHNYQVNFIYMASILENKQVLSNMIDYETTQVSYITRIAVLADSYIFCSNFPPILCIIAIDSYTATYMKVAFLNK